MIAEFIQTDDPRWARMLKRTRHDFYHLPGYVALCAETEHAEPCAFYAQSTEGMLLVPLLIRSLPPDLGAPADWRDATSPYGYPSPLISGVGGAAMAGRLLSAFTECAARAAIVSVFIRLHPLLPIDTDALRHAGTLVRHGKTVYADLGVQEEEALWMQMHPSHRRGIRKLRRLGYETAIDEWSLEDDFERVYRQTMERVAADEAYFFDRHYFRELRRALGDALHLWVVRAPDGDVAAAGLFSEMCGTVQFHLSGTDAQHVQHAPSKLMLYAVMQWARTRGNRFFHLGGGLGVREDSLFTFKAGFSPHRAEFQTLRIVADPQRYRPLVEARGIRGLDNDALDTGFFPLYRASTAAVTAPTTDSDRG